MQRHFVERSSSADAVPRFERPIAALQVLEKELEASRLTIEEQQREIDLACVELIRHRNISIQLLERLHGQGAAIAATGEIRHCTGAFADLLESNPHDLQSRSILDYLRPDQNNQFLSLCRECIKGHRDASFDSLLTVAGRPTMKVRLTIMQLPGWTLADQAVAAELLLIVTPHPVIAVEAQESQQSNDVEDLSEPSAERRDTIPSEPVTCRHSLPTQQAAAIDSIGWYAGGLAHEFNNVLTAVTCNISMALMELPEGDSAVPLLKDAAQAVSQATVLTRQLLEFSRRQPTLPELARIDSLIERLIPSLERRIGERHPVRTRHEEDSGVVNMDPRQFEMILINLVRNARDAMPDGGTVLIESANLVIAQKCSATRPPLTPGSYVVMRVVDSGCGMTQQAIEHLFEPFCTTKPHGQAAGLGLATSYTAVRQAGGGIEVSSSVGRGTCVAVYLPRILDLEQAPLTARASTTPDGGPDTILLVEDQATLRTIGARILNRLGYRVICAANGVEALEAVAKHQGRIDLLFTDIVMPGMSGRELASRLHMMRPDMKILYTSGYADGMFRDGQDELSPITRPSDHLSKPYLPETLASRIKDILHPQHD